MTKLEPAPRPLRQPREPALHEEALEAIPDFLQLSLAQLPWKRGAAYESQKGIVYPSSAAAEFFFQGRQVAFMAGHERIESDLGDLADEFSFGLRRGQGELVAQVHVSPPRGEASNATTDIIKTDAEHDLPPGIGLALYRKTLDFLQALADQRREPIDHIVTRYPEISQTPLSVERWNELFLPILEEYGYSALPFATGNWSKRYEPRQKPPAKPRESQPATLGFTVRRRDLTD